MKRAAPGPIDCVLDLLPLSAGTKTVRAAATTLREFGRVVLMGGVGMLGRNDLALPYPWIMRIAYAPDRVYDPLTIGFAVGRRFVFGSGRRTGAEARGSS